MLLLLLLGAFAASALPVPALRVAIREGVKKEQPTDGIIVQNTDGIIVQKEKKSTDGMIVKKEQPTDGIIVQNTDGIIVQKEQKSTDGMIVKKEQPTSGIIVQKELPTDGIIVQNTDGIIVQKEQTTDGIIVQKGQGDRNQAWRVGSHLAWNVNSQASLAGSAILAGFDELANGVIAGGDPSAFFGLFAPGATIDFGDVKGKTPEEFIPMILSYGVTKTAHTLTGTSSPANGNTVILSGTGVMTQASGTINAECSMTLALGNTPAEPARITHISATPVA